MFIQSVCVHAVPFKLQEGVVRIISLIQCQSYFDMKTITPRMLCAGYDAGTVDSCMVTLDSFSTETVNHYRQVHSLIYVCVCVCLGGQRRSTGV